MITLSTRCTAVGTLVRGTRGRQKSTADRTADSTANSTADETRWSFKKNRIATSRLGMSENASIL